MSIEAMKQALEALISSTGELRLRLASPTDAQLVKNEAAITALRTALAEPTSQQPKQVEPAKWISIEENLPKEGQPVLGLYYKSNIRIVYRKAREIIDDRWVIEDGWVEPSSGHSLIPPTHWMPLPEYEHVHKMESKATINELETVEPVAWRFHDGKIWCYVTHISDLSASNKFEPLYAAPPKRNPLSKSFLEEMAEKHVTHCYFDTLTYARAIERAHDIGGEE